MSQDEHQQARIAGRPGIGVDTIDELANAPLLKATEKSTSTIGIPMPAQDACAFLDADRKAEWLKHISLLYGVLPSD